MYLLGRGRQCRKGRNRLFSQAKLLLLGSSGDNIPCSGEERQETLRRECGARSYSAFEAKVKLTIAVFEWGRQKCHKLSLRDPILRSTLCRVHAKGTTLGTKWREALGTRTHLHVTAVFNNCWPLFNFEFL